MDDRMMKAGGSAARAKLIEAFGDLSVSKTVKREMTDKEKTVARHGDKDQAQRLLAAKKY